MVRYGESIPLQLPHEVNQVVLLLRSEFEFQHQVEELHAVFECQHGSTRYLDRAFITIWSARHVSIAAGHVNNREQRERETQCKRIR